MRNERDVQHWTHGTDDTGMRGYIRVYPEPSMREEPDPDGPSPQDIRDFNAGYYQAMAEMRACGYVD